jgi:hypothetical protein
VLSDTSKGLAMVRQQIDELESLEKQTLQDLNTVAGTERIAKWKARTVALVTNTLGHRLLTTWWKNLPILWSVIAYD